jgi:hypothetical protein
MSIDFSDGMLYRSYADTLRRYFNLRNARQPFLDGEDSTILYGSL